MFLWLFTFSLVAASDERKNLSVDDIIVGFENGKLFYFEVLLEHGKYSKAFNKCLDSRPADFRWIKQYCAKNPELKNAFLCTEDGRLTYIWFVYESGDKCEEVRKPMKDKMDAMLK